LIVSNELMDAFPIVGLIKEDGECANWGSVGRGSAVECSRWPRSQRAQLALEEMGEYLDPIKEGGTPGGSLSIRDWMMDWVDSFQLGSILTIDYGNSVDDHLRQYPFGSLRAYFRHHAWRGRKSIVASASRT
jgi:SAM-dependent MidA family methyltransferase